ncbi:MAG: hypothetical protein ACI4SG_01350 [Oligosphaeraceae bacterium]
MPDVVVSELPAEAAPATLESAGQLLLLLAVAFLATLLLLWMVILLARFLRRHAVFSRETAQEAAPAREPEKKDD